MPRRTRRGYVGSNWGNDDTTWLPVAHTKGRRRKPREGCGIGAALIAVIVFAGVVVCALGVAIGLRMLWE